MESLPMLILFIYRAGRPSTLVRKEYDALKAEFQLAEEIIKARAKAKMTQAELAMRIGKKSTAISRLESPNYGKASISMLKKVAYALVCELQIHLVPKH